MDQLLTLQQVAAYLNVSPKTVRRLVAGRQIRCVRFVTGLSSAIVGHVPLLRTGWMFWGIVLFTVSGVAFSVWVAPLQKRMLKLMLVGAESGTPDWAAFSRTWACWGAVALLLPIAILALMVLKPPMPGL